MSFILLHCIIFMKQLKLEQAQYVIEMEIDFADHSQELHRKD